MAVYVFMAACEGVEGVRCYGRRCGNEIGLREYMAEKIMEISGVVDQERDCKENSNIFSQGRSKRRLVHEVLSASGGAVWEGAEVVHLQAEETKLEYLRNIVTNSRETPS
uniref:Uncharacterized protein n=1 Tax=Tanacetum cinerariifolium TaxID=118510 RepID=A0A6L2NGG7_TANCI|nr:hypothetical protein [Tanacetum cinerariifolium]